LTSIRSQPLNTLAELNIPAIRGGPPGSKSYADGGCSGYSVKSKPFG